MLASFQRALTELTASPALCSAARADPDLLARRYTLTEIEARRLNGIVRSAGMEANCMLYRANRLAPVALNCPDLCASLGEELNGLISQYWETEPTAHVNFFVETDRFCRFLLARGDLAAGSAEALEREHSVLLARLSASREMAGRNAFAD
ncbi:MAG TPA: hypothetical protein VGC56_17595 [Allosphingosinicella sp.]|jgi:hypothetical protein